MIKRIKLFAIALLTLVSVLATTAEALPVDTPMGWWKFDESTGSVASDSSSNGYDGTLVNMDDSDWVPGQLGNALDFDGTDDYVVISGYQGITGGNSRTCAAWIKTTTPSSQIFNWGTFLDGQRWTVRVNTDGTLRVEVHGGYIYGTTSVADGNWHHVAVVLESDGSPDVSELILYVDGARETIGGVSPYAINTVASSDVKIGVNLLDTVFFQGLIDDVRIYDYALSSEEIYHLLNPDHSWNPSPADTISNVPIESDLNWLAGEGAISHDVYFGTDETAVTNAQRLAGDFNGNGTVDSDDLEELASGWLTSADLEDFSTLAADWGLSSSVEFIGNQIETTYTPVSLEAFTTYYWRIDEVSAAGTTVTGEVRSFTTVPIGGDEVGKWQMYEVWLTGSGTPANPFTDVTLTATVTKPDSTEITVDGFYDGDGNGGQNGNVWKLRFSPDQIGPWSWKTTSNNSGLDNQSGYFQCVSSSEPGPIVVNNRYFEYANGEQVYLIGNFLERSQPTYEQFSHTLFSEEISETNRQNMIARHRDFHKANKMNVYIANDGDYGDISTTPWLGSDNSNDKTRFDLSRWKMYDRLTAQLKDEGMIAELWFFADDSNFGSLSYADRQRLIKYAMARLSAYSHTMFVLCLEWQEGWSISDVDTNMTYGQNHNPWDRLWSVHGTTGNFSFPGYWWADFMATQSGNDITPSSNNSHTITNRGLANKPLIVEEFGLLDTAYDERLRGNLWACFCGGGAGSGTGSDLRRLRQFIENEGVEYWNMAPNNSVTTSGFGLVNPGQEYVVYVENGGTFTVTLAAGTYDAQWFSPRQTDGTAGPITIGTVSGGAQGFTTPGPSDWVLHIKAAL